MFHVRSAFVFGVALLGLGRPDALRAQDSVTEKDAILLRDAHYKSVGSRAHRRFYTQRWDLSDVPAYRPEAPVSGVIRVRGGNSYLVAGDVMRFWMEDFKRFQPGIRFEFNRYDLETGLVDVVARPPADWSKLQEFQDAFGYYPFAIDYSTGSYNVPGWCPAFAMYVQKDNPLNEVSLDQLDGIFGCERRGGWEGTVWHPEFARGPEKNIRQWGQLGFGGAYRDADIHVYGRPMRYHIQLYFERKVMHGADLWNEKLREYAHELKPDKTRSISSIDMAADVGKDPYGIAMSDLGSLNPNVKVLAISRKTGGPAIPLTLENVRSRQYPLFLENYLYVNRPPGKPLDPKIREFLRYVLSREGQDAIQRDGKWLPLDGQVTARERAKLD